MEKIEIKSIQGKVLFSHQEENNTIKKTLEKAVDTCANLQGANLKGATLEYANLTGANLQGANLKGATLEGADLQVACLKGATLEGAYLKGAKLEYANLQVADLKGANLTCADLKGANLKGADLKGSGLFQIHGLGSAGRCTTFDTINKNVICGCFSGTFEEFEKKIKETHEEDSIHRSNYLLALEMAKNVKL